jgi:DNA polymerase-1
LIKAINRGKYNIFRTLKNVEGINIYVLEKQVKKMQNKWLLITTSEELNEILDIFADVSVIAIDTETTGLNPHTSSLRLIQLAVENEPVIIIDCFKMLPDGAEILQSILGSNAVKIFQNAKFDIQFLRAAGIEVKGRIFDTMLAGQLLRSSGGSSKVNLKRLCEHYLDEALSKEEQLSDFSGELSDNQLNYAAKDAEVLLRLRKKMITEIKRNKLIEIARVEFACVYAIADIEYSGIYISMEKWLKLTSVVEKEKKETLEKLYPYIGYPTVQIGFFESVESSAVNLNSNKQVINILKKHGINIENSSRRTLSQYMDHPIVGLLLEHRYQAKALSTFLYGLTHQVNPVTGRLHPRYGQNGAYSGRMSCGSPNIQQIPREERFRECFTAPEGRKLVIADYSQIELRVIAQFSQDERMIDAYKKGEDLHKLTASLMLQKNINEVSKSERQAAKAVNFGLVFGMGAKGLKAYAAETYQSKMSLEEAELFRKRFFQGYRGLARWHREIRRNLPEEERTLAGRKFVFSKNSGMSGRYNIPVQGTAADILKNALGLLHLALVNVDAEIVAVVHDEIVIECGEEIANEIAVLLSKIMEEAGARYLVSLPVIAEATIADSWAGK